MDRERSLILSLIEQEWLSVGARTSLFLNAETINKLTNKGLKALHTKMKTARILYQNEMKKICKRHTLTGFGAKPDVVIKWGGHAN